MKIRVTCGDCGQRQEVPASWAGKRATCSTCGKPVSVPALGIAAAPKAAPAVVRSVEVPGPPPTSTVPAAALVLILGGLLLLAAGVVGIRFFGPNTGRAAPSSVVEPPVQAKEAPGTPLPTRPVVEIASAEPAQPSAGEALTVKLHGVSPAGGALKYQFRLGPREEWRTAPGGTIVLPELRGGRTVALEFRAVDPAGVVSEVRERRWEVGPERLAKRGDLPPAKDRQPDPPPVAKAPAPDKPAAKPPGQFLAKALFREKEAFRQELTVEQRTDIQVPGAGAPAVSSAIKYQVLSRFHTEKVREDGSATVVQTVETARFLEADQTSGALLAGAMAQLPGSAFTLELTPAGQVTKLTGGKVGPQALGAGSLGLQTASLMDADAWKEMAQITFFQPEAPLGTKPAQWSQPMTHNWGPLGNWAGTKYFAYLGDRKGSEAVVHYKIAMKFQSGRGGGGLLLQIENPQFQAQRAEGWVVYDAQSRRAISGGEAFRATGSFDTALGRVGLQGQQQFSLKMVP